ncbi:MAG: hypothetical protein ACTSP6_05825 [Promethearchaeota archaeon]
MCFYITTSLPKNTKLEELRNLFNKYNMAFSPLKNANISSQLRPEELYLRATKDYCDCGTILGSLNQLKEYQTLLNSKKVKTLKKKKWTEEEIDKWIQEKLNKKESKHGKKRTPLEEELEINRWLDFLHGLLDSKKVSRIGLLKHWYTRGLHDEEIRIKRTEKAQINAVTSDFLLNLEEDVLYEFFPSYKH